MFAFLVLVAIFSSALPFEAAAHHNIHKCDQNRVDQIYAYWRSNGGPPQHVTERNLRCSPRQIPFLSTQNYFDEDVTCAVLDHSARSQQIHYLTGNTVSYIHQADTEEFNGQMVESLHLNVRFEIARAGRAELVYMCTRRSDAKEGSGQFMIKGVENITTEEDIKTLQNLLTTTFECNEPLRSYPGCSSRLLNEKPHPVEAYCPSSSSSHHHH